MEKNEVRQDTDDFYFAVAVTPSDEKKFESFSAE